MLINANGGALSQGGASANKINGVSYTNPAKQTYIKDAIMEFGYVK